MKDYAQALKLLNTFKVEDVSVDLVKRKLRKRIDKQRQELAYKQNLN